MSRTAPRLLDYLSHMLEAIERINVYTEDLNELTFLQNQMAQDAILRNLEIIGEASHHIQNTYPEFAAAHNELPLSATYQMRNAIAHGYFKVDLEIVWKTIRNDLPHFYLQVRQIVEDV